MFVQVCVCVVVCWGIVYDNVDVDDDDDVDVDDDDDDETLG